VLDLRSTKISIAEQSEPSTKITGKSELLKDLEEKQLKLSQIDQQLELRIDPNLKEALDWLANSQRLAQRIVNSALEKCLNLKHLTQNNSSLEKRINWEFEKYIDNIHNSLLTKNRELLDQPPISPFVVKEGSLFALEEKERFKAEEGIFYTLALDSLKDAIPKRFSEKIKFEIIDYIDNLRDNLPN
jgi:hypothetical protein